MAGGDIQGLGQRVGFGARRVDDPNGGVHSALTLTYSPPALNPAIDN